MSACLNSVIGVGRVSIAHDIPLGARVQVDVPMLGDDDRTIRLGVNAHPKSSDSGQHSRMSYPPSQPPAGSVIGRMDDFDGDRLAWPVPSFGPGRYFWAAVFGSFTYV